MMSSGGRGRSFASGRSRRVRRPIHPVDRTAAMIGYRAGAASALLILIAALLLPCSATAGADADRAALARLSQEGVDHYRADRYAEAAAAFGKALAVAEKTLGPSHATTAQAAENLAKARWAQGRYDEATVLYGRSLSIREQAFGGQHAKVGDSHFGLAQAQRAKGRLTEAARHYRAALDIWTRHHGVGSAEAALGANDLGGVYLEQARYDEARSLLLRALDIRERLFGANDLRTLMTMQRLAALHLAQGDFDEAEALLKTVLARVGAIQGPDDPDVAFTLTALATIETFARSRPREAAALLERAASLYERTLGTAHPQTAIAGLNLAWSYLQLGDLKRALTLSATSHEAIVRTFGRDHLLASMSLTILGNIHFDIYWKNVERSHLETARRYHQEALAIRSHVDQTHPLALINLSTLTEIELIAGRPQEALGYARQATRLYRDRLRLGTRLRSTGLLTEQRFAFAIDPHQHLQQHLAILARMEKERPDRSADFAAEAFELAQVARLTGTAQALNRMAARFAAGDDRLAALVRERQDALSRWHDLSSELSQVRTDTADQATRDTAARLRATVLAADEALNRLDRALAETFPDYIDLVAPAPLSLEAARSLLARDEALLVYVIAEPDRFLAAGYHVPIEDRVDLWVVRHDRHVRLRLPVGPRDVMTLVRRLRQGVAVDDGRPRPFDLDLARTAHGQLLAPADPLLAGVHHLLVVPDGALASLPLGLLVASDPAGGAADTDAYRDAAWLVRRYAVSTLPAVSSLRGFRRVAAPPTGDVPFTGFGDPSFGDDRRHEGPATLASRYRAVGLETLHALPPLPETAAELHAIARRLGAEDSRVFLRQRATETMVKSVDLSRTRVLAFATHALVAGELVGALEPALVLTPPSAATEVDDGLLTASEAAQLRLNADWVILSACNTAAPDGTPGGEGLSGLAKAFFYAGGRTLLVSHWPVPTAAAVRMTTGVFDALADDPAIRRSEAVRRSMLAVMETPAPADMSHPIFWAPFALVGDGGHAASTTPRRNDSQLDQHRTTGGATARRAAPTP